jgi:hypothetical protein
VRAAPCLDIEATKEDEEEALAEDAELDKVAGKGVVVLKQLEPRPHRE